MHSFKGIAIIAVATILVHLAVPAFSDETKISELCKQPLPPLWCIEVTSGTPPVGPLGGSIGGSINLEAKDPAMIRKDMMLNLSPNIGNGF
jgi:hypothetical protein